MGHRWNDIGHNIYKKWTIVEKPAQISTAQRTPANAGQIATVMNLERSRSGYKNKNNYFYLLI
jgi:hypothetical protein